MPIINTQSPDLTRSGSSLSKQSTPGTRVDFVNRSTIGGTSFVLAAGTGHALQFTLTLYPQDLPVASQASGLQIPQLSLIAIPMMDIFIDNDNDYNYEYGDGPSLSAGQQKISASRYDAYAPPSGASYVSITNFINHDSGSHTIYIRNAYYKYIQYGEETV